MSDKLYSKSFLFQFLHEKILINFPEPTVYNLCDIMLLYCCREVHLINIIIITVAAVVVEFNIKVYDHIIIIYIFDQNK